jgi:hypothetical protein
MIRKSYILIIFALFYNTSNGQLFYKNKLEPRDGIEIKYKVRHVKMFDKNSPVMLCLKLTNTNDSDVNLKFEVEYSTGFTTKYKSGEVDICIPKNMTRRGKARGLAFELNSTDKNILASEDIEWEFTTLKIDKIEKCEK